MDTLGWILVQSFTAITLLYLSWHFWNFRQVRGPFVWPIVGDLPQMMCNHSRMHDWVTQQLQKFGGTYFTYVWIVPGMRKCSVVVTSDPVNIEYVLKTNFGNFPKGPDWQDAFHDLLGNGIFNSDGELWVAQRKTAALEFTAKSLKSFVVGSIWEQIHDGLLPVLTHAIAAQRRRPLDLQDVLLRFTFDNVCRISFGKDPRSLLPGLPANEFATAFELATEATLQRVILPGMLWRLKRALRLGKERHFEQSLRLINKFAKDIIESRRELFSKCKTSDSKLFEDNNAEGADKLPQSDLLSRFMQKKDDQGVPYTDEFLRDTAINFILAGRDTSSVALTWFFWLLDKHPRVEQAILQELLHILSCRKDQTLPSDGSIAAAQKARISFSYEELEKMSYLKAALSETMRLYPPVPLETRYVLHKDTLPDGTNLLEGSHITYSIYAMGRLQSIWGHDCLEFKPERWLQNGRYKTPENHFQFIAFNAGPRVCLGKEMAYLQMKCLAAALILHYRIQIVPQHLIQQKISLTLFMKHGLLVHLQPRNPNAASSL
ncbi:hypothetical protein O6H91_14G043300 [Diphasiastrum complanatum]|uniref:Uncharacterized protein n=1 Tax=Diphasiastrum complanatum TaxID=34168 RepID=A0ACC2BNV1_DIPCM|nr:hypothetical protein O6H91_14G043300 [Diphasiastrum complanatum]